MKVSVVLTTFNRAHVLPETIDLVLSQTYTDFELIISDDCSTDNTENICREYEKRDSRIRYRRNKTNLKMPGNLNAGIKASSGSYIANLHDGDIYEQSLLEKWVMALDSCPKAGFVFNAYRALGPDGKETHIFREPLPAYAPGSVLLQSIFFKRWRFGSPVWGTVMGRRSAYEKVGLFDASFGFQSDVDMWLRLAESYHVAYIDEPLISLPHRETMPRQITLEYKKELRRAEQMFWEARIRHFRTRPLRLALEVIRHEAFVVANRVWISALKARRKILS